MKKRQAIKIMRNVFRELMTCLHMGNPFRPSAYSIKQKLSASRKDDRLMERQLRQVQPAVDALKACGTPEAEHALDSLSDWLTMGSPRKRLPDDAHVAHWIVAAETVWSEQSACFITTVDGAQGCSAYGDTEEESVSEFAIALSLVVCRV